MFEYSLLEKGLVFVNLGKGELPRKARSALEAFAKNGHEIFKTSDQRISSQPSLSFINSQSAATRNNKTLNVPSFSKVSDADGGL